MDKTYRSWNVKKQLRTSLIFMLFFCQNAVSEYRAYQYLITNKITQDNYTVVSSYDPRAYIAYHGGPESIELEMLRTWICLGYTGKKKDICDSPTQKMSELTELQ